MRARAALVVALLCALALGLALVPGRANAGQLRGVVLTPTFDESHVGLTTAEADRDTAAACQLGSRVVRFVVNWAALEPAPGRYRSGYAAGVDRMLARLSGCGAPVVLTLIGTPCWASTAPWASYDCAAGAWRYPPRTSAAFADFAGWVVGRWGPRLAAIEVWNEPNTAAYWRGTVQQYVGLVDAAVDRVHAMGSPVPVLAGALWGADPSYLAQMYAAGLRGQGGISIHPYTFRYQRNLSGFYDPRSSAARPGSRKSRGGRSIYKAIITRAHRTMLAAGDHSGLWLTEFGYSVCPAKPWCVSAAKQAMWLRVSLRAASKLRYVSAAIVYSLRDASTSLDWNCRFGLIGFDGTRRPSYWALRRLFAGHSR